MKKIFTLIVALMATMTMMAQTASTGTMEFLGTCKRVRTVASVDLTAETTETVKFNVDYTKFICDVTIPAMTLKSTGVLETKVSATTFLAVPFTMEGTNIKWSITTPTDFKTYYDDDPTYLSSETVTNLTGSYTIGGTLKFDMTWSERSITEHFTITDGKYTPTAISEVSATESASQPVVRKTLVGGKLIIMNNGKQYNAAGAQVR